MNASNICRSPEATATLPCFQVIHMGVACLNAQLFTHEQEDDLEHAGHLFFSQSQRQHANLTENLVHKPGDLECFLSENIVPVFPHTGRHAKTTVGPALSWMGWIQVVAALRTERPNYIDFVLA